ncbi:Bifunctional polynucleotide phosphatase/kinase-like [Oopsacas minuta]|uniref:Bifunctional polynucleotide phosphatase/kinase-like n=1 Tax=Oopsacas minuta TaxID=111878 RepID=A0AAV7JYQ7_9METZ|nr:Bifunctional polynucleotide phosphatase/kinase-like [Oopsacas minuta]
MSKRGKTTQGGAATKSRKKVEGASGGDFKFDMQWREYGDALTKGVKPIVYLDGPDCMPSDKIAAFDIDHTIVKPKSGKKFSANKDDWVFLYEEVPKKLKSLFDEGIKLVFITNQGGIEKGRTDISELKHKFCRMIDEIGAPVQVYILTGYNHYRKPNSAIWNLIVEKFNGGIKVDLSKSFFCGDAAGRAKDWSPGKVKDFSCDDRKFGVNIGVNFYTPEEFFLSEKCTVFDWRTLDPTQLIANFNGKNIPNFAEHPTTTQEMVIMVGRPASGKSTFTKRYLVPEGYIRINRDTLLTPAKCQKEAQKAIDEGKSVSIDNTNPKVVDRAVYIEMAKTKKIPVRCFYFKTSPEIASHLNFFRQNQTQGEVRRIPLVAYRIYDKYFEAPTKQEGFDDVIEIDFYPNFDNSADEALFGQWTPENT